MTKIEIRQQEKNETLNKIIELYKSPNYESGVGLNNGSFCSESWAEQRDDRVRDLIVNLLKKIK